MKTIFISSVLLLSTVICQPATYNFLEGTYSVNVTINNVYNILWTTELNFGTPAQQLAVQVDTGSNLLWVASSRCHYCEMTNQYYYNKSSTYQSTGSVEFQAYGSGECYGVEVTDQVGLAGSSVDTKFEFLSVSYETGFSLPQNYSGIMGLSNNQSFINLFQASYRAGEIASPIYGLSLQPNPFISSLLYDSIDSKISNAVTWINSSDEYRWELPLQGVQYAGINQTLGVLRSGILDSGTSCLILETNLYDTLYNNYLSNVCNTTEGVVYCPCRPTAAQASSLPVITLQFPGVSVNVNYTSYMADYYTQSSGLCPVCISPISAQQAPFMIFGDPVLKSVVALFDKDNNRMGLYAPQ